MRHQCAGVTDVQREHLLGRWAQGGAGEALEQGSGLGLGLAIVAEYARIMGAQLSMVSPASAGQGLKVSLRFAL